MGQKRYTAEQIISKLRQADVGLSKRRLELPEQSPEHFQLTFADLYFRAPDR